MKYEVCEKIMEVISFCKSFLAWIARPSSSKPIVLGSAFSFAKSIIRLNCRSPIISKLSVARWEVE